MGARTGRPGPDPKPAATRFAAQTRLQPAPPGTSVDGPCVIWTAADRGFTISPTQTQNARSFMIELMTGIRPDLQHHPVTVLCGESRCLSLTHIVPMERCVAGHPFDEANTKITKTGVRRCRACAARRQREYARTEAGKRVHRETNRRPA